MDKINISTTQQGAVSKFNNICRTDYSIYGMVVYLWSYVKYDFRAVYMGKKTASVV
jgi:hypothetical protein